MPRSPSLPLYDLDDLSSPDPLANSFSDHAPAATRSPTRPPSPQKRRLSSPARNSKSKRSVQRPSSPSSSYSYAHTPVSPSRTITEQTLSPWKIRVTVEAEHEDGDEAGATMTRTIKVPLREESSPLNAERTARRGRRTAPVSARTRSSVTPTRRNGSRPRSRRQSVTDLNVAPLGDDGDGDEWTGKKPSPRKKRVSRSQPAQSEQSDGLRREEDEESEGTPTETVMHTTTTSPPFQIHEDINADTEADHVPFADKASLSVSRSPELRQIDLNRVSVRQRSQSTKREEGRSEWSDKIHGSEIGHGMPVQSTRQVSATSAASYPTPSPTSSYHGSDEVEKTVEATQGQENFDTMLESEGFTMIDLDTIPSVRQYRTSPEEQKGGPELTSNNATARPTTNFGTPQPRVMSPSSRKKPTPIPSYLTTADDESELSSNVPSSPPAADTSMLAVPARPLRSGDRKVTPQTYSSPSLPPPPPPQKITSTNDRPEIPPQEVLEAGTALQDAVISPNGTNDALPQEQSSRNPVQRRSDFFNGFSSGTKRELRAGLRFGEELAKRQRPTSSSSSAQDEAPAAERHIYRDNVRAPLKPQVTTQVWRGETTVQHSPFATESSLQTKKTDHERASDGRMDDGSLLLSNKTTTTTTASSKLARSNTQAPKTSLPDCDTPELNTTARRKHEWQLEREAVSRKVENADPRQVVVIDSDDDEKKSNTRRSRTSNRSVESEQTAKRPGRGSANSNGNRHLSTGGREIPREAGDEIVQDRPEEQRALLSSVASSSSDVEEDNDEDIWLDEAKERSSSPREQDSVDAFTRTEQQRQRDRAAELINKPRRSLIPSPWKRGEDVAEASTLMSDGAMSGFFWQQQTPVQEAIKFGAGEIARQKRQSSGNFDLETMLSSPVKVAAVGRKNLTLRKDGAFERHQDDIDNEVGDGEVEENESQASDISEADESQQDVSKVAESQSSSASSPLQPQTVPVKFNDSTMSAMATPPRQKRPSPTEVAERARLTPPRSAMKGARLSFSPPKQDPHSDLRRVVFNERSLYLNSDGEESTMSAHLDSPLPEPKPNHAFHNASVSEEVEEAVDHREWINEQKKRSSWLGWMLPGTTDEKSATHADSTPSIPKVDGADEGPAEDTIEVQVEDEVDKVEDKEAEEHEHWQSTKTSVPTNSGHHRPSYSPSDPEAEPQLQSNEQRHPHTSHQQPRVLVNGISNPARSTNPPTNSSFHLSSHPEPTSTAKPVSSSRLPSYLLPPSYPSLPTRDPSIPLSVSGPFTNTHFRTLHIIHAKSQRPRFHGPKRIRPAIRKLLGWKLEVDESKTIGLNARGESENSEGSVFEWTLGTTEAAVLERFMQEVEFGHIFSGSEEIGVDGKVRWGWRVEELARKLGMIVVGEAVRSEEGGKGGGDEIAG